MAKYKILDLFSGAGGFSLGLDRLKEFETKIGVDYDKHAANTFQKNFPNATGICGDLKDNDLKVHIVKLSKKEKINMIIGGPPCQGFSLKGKNLGLDDPRNYLFLEYLNLVEAIRPEIFIIENVKNMVSSGNKYFINQIKTQFSELGYIVEYGILNAYDFGVPQKRERAIIIGSLKQCIPLPKPLNINKVTVRDAIYDLAYLNSGEGSNVSEYINEATCLYQESLRGDKLYHHIATNHSEVALNKLKMIPPEGDKSSLPEHLHGKQKFSTTWSRLEWDKPSPTIDTRFDTPSNGRNSHPFLHRSITPREAARIQSFPDNFIFTGPKGAICRQIGNAVPPLLSEALGKHILKELSLNNYHSGNDFTIYHANAYNKIKELQRNNITVNHIITDPPYNISQNNNFNTMNNPRAGVDFGNWDHGEFDLYSWIHDYEKILHKNGSMLIFCSYRFISFIIKALEINNMVVKDIIIWQKTNPMPRNINRRYVQDSEFAIWAVKKKAKWVFNKPDNVPYQRAFFQTPTVSGTERTLHPTQKSLKLMEDLIKIHTNEGDIILDPFMGSGTTGVAALNNNRKFIGIELQKDYFKIAKARLS